MDGKGHGNLADMAKIISAFVVVQMVKDSQSSQAASISPARLVRSAGEAIVGATNILDRGGERLGDAERTQLRDLVSGWSKEIQAFSSAEI